MSILRICMQRWDILAILVAISIGISIAANGVVSIENTSSNVGTNNTNNVSILGMNYTTADQWIEIVNKGTSNVSFNGWMLMNKENLSYFFPADFFLKSGALVKVHSMACVDNSTDLYNSSVLWRKNGDTAILRDATGDIVSEYSYSAMSANAIKGATDETKSNITTPNVMAYKANNSKTTTSNVTTKTSKEISKITIVK